MKLSKDQEQWLLGALTAQGYLLELLIGAQFRHRPSPLAELEAARIAIQKQIRFDMRVPPTDNPHADHLAIQQSAATHLDEMFDRVKTQLVNTANAGGER